MTEMPSRLATNAAQRRAQPTWLVPLACLLGAGTLLGLSANFAKVAAAHSLDPLAFLAWSVLGGAILLGACRGVGLSRGRARYLVVSAALTLVLPNLVFFAAVPRVGASLVALAIAFPPLLTYVGALAMRLEGFRVVRALGVASALGGAILLAARGLEAPGASHGWILGTLLAPVFLAAGNLYRTVAWPPGARPAELAPGMLAVAGVSLVGLGAIGLFPLSVPTDRLVPALLIALQAFAFAAQFRLFFVLQERGGPVFLSLLGSVAAATGVPVAILVLGEAPLAGLAPAALLIALGVLLVARRGKGESVDESSRLDCRRL